MAFLADLICHNLKEIDSPPYNTYEKIIRDSFAENPPYVTHWFGRRYFELARNAEWFANSLVANSALEGYGSTQVWNFSNRVMNDDYSQAIRQHALDESKHSTMFIQMLHWVFPGLNLDDGTLDRIDSMQPRYTRHNHPSDVKLEPEQLLMGHDVLDELIQIHITEIRALVLQFLLRPVLLTYAPEENRAKLRRASDVLIRDEAKHIRYTAEFFEDAAKAGEADFLFETFKRRSQDFNDTTLEELEREVVEV